MGSEVLVVALLYRCQRFPAGPVGRGCDGAVEKTIIRTGTDTETVDSPVEVLKVPLLGAAFDEIEVLVAEREQRDDPRRRERGSEVRTVVTGLRKCVGLAIQDEPRRHGRGDDDGRGRPAGRR